MDKKFDFKIVPEKKLIIEYLKGDISYDDFIQLKESQFSDKDYDPHFNILDDFRDANFLFNYTKVLDYIKYVKKSKIYYGNKRTALLTNTPNQVVISTFFSIVKEELPFKVDLLICSTLENAQNHLGISNDDDIKPILENFRIVD